MLSEQQQIIYNFIKYVGTEWVQQKAIVQFRGKDDSRTRKLLLRMKNDKILTSKKQPSKNEDGTIRMMTLWKIKEKQ